MKSKHPTTSKTRARDSPAIRNQVLRSSQNPVVRFLTVTSERGSLLFLPLGPFCHTLKSDLVEKTMSIVTRYLFPTFPIIEPIFI
jgi:hypothetical protein